MVSMRPSSPGPNRSAWAASRSLVSAVTSTSVVDCGATRSTYRSRRCSRASRVNWCRSWPASTTRSTQASTSATRWAASASARSKRSSTGSAPSTWATSARVTLGPAKVSTWSSRERPSRWEPSAALATSSSAAGSMSTPSASQILAKSWTRAAVRMRRKSWRWQRDRMASITLCGSVVQKMNRTCSGGSSSTFSIALKPWVVTMWASSMM